jgi:uncharacterized lipoprotein YddW (UPF0748 family)
LLKVQYRKTVDFAALQAAGFDAISYNVPIGGTSGLRAMIDGAHAAGMRLFVWIAFGVDAALVRKWPGAGGMLDFSQEAARAAIAQVISNLLQQFPDLDGVALDYMRRWDTTDDPAVQTNYGNHITDAVEKIAEAAEGKIIIAHVKAYVDDWSRWCQNWPQWLDEGLIEFVAPMCYQPLSSRYGGFARHAQSWLWVADQEKIIPTLAIIDTAASGEPLKPVEVIAEEIAWFREQGYTDFAFFDNRVTAAQMAAIAAALPVGMPEPEPTVDLSESLAILRTQATEMHRRAAMLRQVATADDLTADMLDAEALRIEITTR